MPTPSHRLLLRVNHFNFPCRETPTSSCMACHGGFQAGSGRVPGTLTRTQLWQQTMSSDGSMGPRFITTSPSTTLGWVTQSRAILFYSWSCENQNRLLENHDRPEKCVLQLQAHPGWIINWLAQIKVLHFSQKLLRSDFSSFSSRLSGEKGVITSAAVIDAVVRSLLFITWHDVALSWRSMITGAEKVCHGEASVELYQFWWPWPIFKVKLCLKGEAESYLLGKVLCDHLQTLHDCYVHCYWQASYDCCMNKQAIMYSVFWWWWRIYTRF